MTIIDTIGIAGMAIILVLFLLNQVGRASRKSLLYDAGNFVGAALLCIYAYFIGSTPFLILNAVWALVSLRDVLRRKFNL